MAQDDPAGRVDPPTKLYKYRTFGVQCLRALTQAELYYSDPRRFNDPLDCSPTIEADVDLATLTDLLYVWKAEKTNVDIARRTLAELRDDVIEINATDDQLGTDLWLTDIIAQEVLALLTHDFGSRGVLSLSEKWNSPLMWSHYADQHHGVCIEYDAAILSHPHLEPINYHSPRVVMASDIVDWKINKSKEAERRIYQTYFLSKSPEWEYEKEWRDIADDHGPTCSSMPVTAILFGMRCDPAVRVSLISLLHGEKGVNFYEIYPNGKTFELERRYVEPSEERAMSFRTSALLDFARVPLRPEEMMLRDPF